MLRGTRSSNTNDAPPCITRLHPVAPSAGRYQKFEITFEITPTFPPNSFLPYYFYDPADALGRQGITMDAHFRAPSGQRLRVPAFYFQRYRRFKTWRGHARYKPIGAPVWQIRFAPQELGEYSFFLTLENCNGTTRYPERGALKFTCVPSSSKGFVRVSPRDPRFFEFDNGESFVPISSGQQWWRSAARSFEYDRAFEAFGAHGINLTRIWTQCDGWALTVEGPFDGYGGYRSPQGNPEDDLSRDLAARAERIATLPKGTQMNPRGTFELDCIVQAAERNGVYLQLCSVGAPQWIWDKSVTDTSQRQVNWNPNPAAWTDPAYIAYWKRNFRYRVARWGYSTAIFAWELVNEHPAVPVGSEIYHFYQTYGAYQRETDPYHHLRTTSQQSQTWSPGLFSSDAFDIANYHDYMMPSRHPDELTYDAAQFVYRIAQCLRTPNADCGLPLGDGSVWQGAAKPIVWGELDTGTAQWNEPNPQPRATHNMRWAGLFSPLGMSPIDWYWEHQSYLEQKYDEAKIASEFFRDVDYAGAQFEYAATDDVRIAHAEHSVARIAVSHERLRVLAMRAADGRRAYAWAQHRDHIWGKADRLPGPLTGTFTLCGMADGTFRIEFWDTYNGKVCDAAIVSSSKGQITVRVEHLERDVAIKILRQDMGAREGIKIA
ncbi:MAG TPA: hypothetical protein VFD70_13090, partial [Anaerolineae bacterium]|nr:hypothetical protein [Anaerolineae bacterium]